MSHVSSGIEGSWIISQCGGGGGDCYNGVGNLWS